MNLFNRLFIFGAMMVSTLTLSAQITGKVVDSKTGNELIGANVYLEGNTRGTSTNVSGEFTLDEDATGNVVVSFLGYETLTLPAQTDMGTISMTTTALGLDEAAVIVGDAPKECVVICCYLVDAGGQRETFPEGNFPEHILWLPAGGEAVSECLKLFTVALRVRIFDTRPALQ